MATGNRTQMWRCAVVETPNHHGVEREARVLDTERSHNKKTVPIGETVIWKLPGPNGAKFESAWRQGMYCGRSTGDDAHFGATRQGMVVARTADDGWRVAGTTNNCFS